MVSIGVQSSYSSILSIQITCLNLCMFKSRENILLETISRFKDSKFFKKNILNGIASIVFILLQMGGNVKGVYTFIYSLGDISTNNVALPVVLILHRAFIKG
uniref:Aa_trans domain-containing protein n=1 Tax=Strongyloides venezuelensis TaxID=75913 RepID=A0A0K0G6A7_STRVS